MPFCSAAVIRYKVFFALATSTRQRNSPLAREGIRPGFPSKRPPIDCPPTKICGREDCPVISKSAARVSSRSMKPGIHSFPKEISS